MKTSELLTDESKWCKGSSRKLDEKGNVVRRCLIGALVDSKSLAEEWHRVDKVISERYPSLWGREQRISRFNDHPKTTFADIQAVMKEANV